MKRILFEHSTAFFATCLVAFCLTLCQSLAGTNEKLIIDAENMMWQKPDSALTILNRVDTALLDKQQKAVYTLLYTQAIDKTDGALGTVRIKGVF